MLEFWSLELILGIKLIGSIISCMNFYNFEFQTYKCENWGCPKVPDFPGMIPDAQGYTHAGQVISYICEPGLFFKVDRTISKITIQCNNDQKYSVPPYPFPSCVQSK